MTEGIERAKLAVQVVREAVRKELTKIAAMAVRAIEEVT